MEMIGIIKPSWQPLNPTIIVMILSEIKGTVKKIII